MRVRAVVVDFDGTIAHDQRPLDNRALLTALRRLHRAGVKIILNTGRDYRYALGPVGILATEHLDLFDAMIFEGGGSVWYAGDAAPRPLTQLCSPELIHEMRRVKIPSEEVWTGHCAVMTLRDHAPRARRAIANVNARRVAREQAPLLLVETVNGRTVSYLPPGVNKGTATQRVVGGHFGIPFSETLGAGDGLNDIAFLSLCGAAIVPRNGHPQVKALRNAIVANGNDADGVVEVLREVIRNGMRIDPPHEHGCSVA